MTMRVVTQWPAGRSFEVFDDVKPFLRLLPNRRVYHEQAHPSSIERRKQLDCCAKNGCGQGNTPAYKTVLRC